MVLSLLIKKFKSSTTSVYLEQPGFSSYNPLILVFQYFFIHKILVHPKKPEKSKKNPENLKNPISDFFEDLKSMHPI